MQPASREASLLRWPGSQRWLALASLLAVAAALLMAYAARLEQAGVPVESRCYDGQIHTFFVNAHFFPVGLESVQWAASRLEEAFAG